MLQFREFLNLIHVAEHGVRMIYFLVKDMITFHLVRAIVHKDKGMRHMDMGTEMLATEVLTHHHPSFQDWVSGCLMHVMCNCLSELWSSVAF